MPRPSASRVPNCGRERRSVCLRLTLVWCPQTPSPVSMTLRTQCSLTGSPIVSDYRCCRLIGRWAPRSLSATATNTVSLAQGSLRVCKAYHYILVLYVLGVFLCLIQHWCLCLMVGEHSSHRFCLRCFYCLTRFG